jgi:YHS domain-containing protein
MRYAYLLCFFAIPVAAQPAKPSAREALKPFNLLVGSWKGSGAPEGPLEERQKGHWTETVAWEWQFKGDDAWLTVAFENGKHFVRGEVRANPARDGFVLKLVTPDKAEQTFAGTLKDKNLVFERANPADKTVERLTVALLHDNRVTYRFEIKPERGTLWTKKYQVGLTKEGVAFADVGPAANECIVSGGKGTTAVSHNGKTYYVCCSGCRDEFKADPEKYVKEWEAKRKK